MCFKVFQTLSQVLQMYQSHLLIFKNTIQYVNPKYNARYHISETYGRILETTEELSQEALEIKKRRVQNKIKCYRN